MDAQKLTLLINYHLREGFVCKLQDICAQALSARTNDHVALFWRAVGLLLESRPAEVWQEVLSPSRHIDMICLVTIMA